MVKNQSLYKLNNEFLTEYKDYGYLNEGFTYAHAYILPVLESLLDKVKNNKILDVGCGNGAVARALMLSDHERKRMGLFGRKLVSEFYSI